MRINFGSNRKLLKDYINVDALRLEGVDVVHDCRRFPYPFDNEYATEINAMEFIEHLPFRVAPLFLKECYRIMKPGAIIQLQCPDIGKMCVYHAENRICECVPRKATKYEDYHGDPHCEFCEGRALIHPERWAYAFAGAQKHAFDNHLSHFTKQSMEMALAQAGFKNIIFKDNIYKIIVKATK